MGKADFLQLGDWNAQCYQCGRKRKAGQMEKNWQGYYVCPEHNEPRQTQDFVRGIADHQTVPWAQPMPTAIYTYTNAQIGIGDGVTTEFQFGSGLGPNAVIYDMTLGFINGISTTFAMDPSGVFSFISVPPVGPILTIIPPKGSLITVTGTETVL